jgi:hypothetical protein
MKIVIATKHLAVDVATSFDVDGREHLVVISKATWSIPQPGERPRPLPPQPIACSDIFVGDPGDTAMLYGSDFARFKPRCDVLFNACAHSPEGQSVTQMLVAWQVGTLKKGLRVVGPRIWRKRIGILGLTKPSPFTEMPLHYGLAFGGSRTYEKGSGSKTATLTEALAANPGGIGWFGKHTKGNADGAPAPCLEAVDHPTKAPDGKYAPTAFSAVARHWEPRKDFAGTYDEAWQTDVFPLLPGDFDEQHHQCAPTDQQMPYPVGGEPVVLRNMVRGRPQARFSLPAFDGLRVRAVGTDYQEHDLRPVVDTLYFEPDDARFTAVWRANMPLQRGIDDVKGVTVGMGDPSRIRKLKEHLGGCAGCSPDLPQLVEG